MAPNYRASDKTIYKLNYMSVLIHNQNSKVYMFLPANFCSGGPELGHQLVDYLRKNSVNAYVVYFSKDETIDKSADVPEQYRHYNIEVAKDVVDTNNNIIIIPETMPDLVRRYQNVKIAIWWMSVDNFYKHYVGAKHLNWIFSKSIIENCKRTIHILLCRSHIQKYNILEYMRKHSDRIVHLYQSVYALNYLHNHELSPCFPLSDYISPQLIPNYAIDHSQKEDVILYNPAKGYDFTQHIIELLPEYKFVALRGFNRQELNELFDRAKLYIDFGNFPGKDRLPRECVLHDCCIITGNLGASAYHEDVPIPDEYKFDITLPSKNIVFILNQIRNVMAHYEERIVNFKSYKKIIIGEQSKFYKEINNLFIENE